jgi:translocation and assembly module TamA
VRADLTRRYGRTSYLTVGASFDLTRTKENSVENPRGSKRDLATLTTLGAFAWDASDNALDPKRGWRLEARASRP